ncbi:LysR family transcriptional regulator [Ornithinicoccus halotolerans]|uniref:LysR family transcriptional regulator n=1 Tax=Ornithinicoccus halotolerans TaxID=1748220 RepID=UPI0012979294|nr:LysR family transcriptional regulator [Ornithinicoccus halotolerans]
MPQLSERLAQLRLDRVRTFLAVVQHGSFSAAGERLYLSQSRVSAHIAELERVFGTVLFDRSRQPVGLTDAGRALLPHARAVLERLHAAQLELAQVEHGGLTGTVTVGMYPSAAAYLFPRLVQALRAEHPGVTVRLWEGATLDLDPALLAGEVDLAVRPAAPEPRGADRLKSARLWTEPLVAVLPPQDPAPDGGALEVADLAGRPVVTIGSGDEGAAERQQFECTQAFALAGVTPQVAFRTNQPQTLLAMVAQGLGVGVTNWLAVHTADHTGLRVLPVQGPGCWREVHLFWRDGGLPPGSPQAVARALRSLPAPPAP